MFDHIAIVKCIELKNEQDRVRWQRDEDAFYRDLADSPLEAVFAVWRRLTGLVRLKPKTSGKCREADCGLAAKPCGPQRMPW